MLSKKTLNGWKIEYSYQPKTNLCNSEIESYGGKNQLRTFYTYDDNAEIRAIIHDDGSSTDINDLTDVTCRRVKTIKTENSPHLASFGKPKEIIESYYSGQQVVPLRYKEFEYDMQGREIAVKVYNSQRIFCYQTTKIYDEFGRIVFETNPLGETTRYAYNENHEKIEEELINSGKITQFHYDSSGNVISKLEKHDFGETFVTNYEYNNLGKIISEVNPYGHKTFYEYDRLGRQILISTISDNAITSKKYNVLDQIIEETDPNGNVTSFSNNVYGNRTKIVYPDGAIERRIYSKNGWLKKLSKADGTFTEYSHDIKGNVVKKSIFAKNEHLLMEEFFVYKGSHLLQKVDSTGLTISYIYDGAGRKIKEIIEDKVTTFHYDDFDRVIKITSALGACEIFTYDAIDRITSKTCQDSSGRIYAKETFAYDIYGNIVEKNILQNEDEWVSYRSKFRSDGNIAWKQDPYGNQTSWEYNHHYINEKGEKVLSCLIRDPLNRESLEINDPHDRLAVKDLFEHGKLVSRTKYTYDKIGNEIERRVSIYNRDKKIREFWVIFAYDSRGELISEKEMPSGKTTSFDYDVLKRLILKILPDGNKIFYYYDSLGRMSELHSSNIHYTYLYDLHDNPIEAKDLINNSSIKRTYSLTGQLLKETFSSEICVHYVYDDDDRLVKLLLPDNSSINYTYDVFHLVKVDRFNSNNEFRYACECPNYDLQGNRLVDKSLGGKIIYSYNKTCRKTKIDSKQWISTLNTFDSIGNLLELTQIDPLGFHKIKFQYDRFDHLTDDGSSQYSYDSLGNCLTKDSNSFNINSSNQMISDVNSSYIFDVNGNLVSQTEPSIVYKYDALGRVIEAGKYSFLYDGFGRCINIKNHVCEKNLFYQFDTEIGAYVDNCLKELRIIHPNTSLNTTFAIEITDDNYFPVQDDRFNITALRDDKGNIVQFSRFTSFGKETLVGDLSILNPWRFANKRQVGDLSLFPKRFYNPQLMRWQSPDTLGFKNDLNLYKFVHNNPLRYHDPDGQFAFVLPILVGTFGSGAFIISTPTLYMIGGALLGGVLGWSTSVIINKCNDHRLLNENTNDKERDEDLPFPGTIAELEEDINWEETSHPEQKKNGHREFKNVRTGEQVRYDKAKDGETGHEGRDHYHRYNTKSTGKHDRYLDRRGNPVKKGSDASHLYQPGTYIN